MTRIDDFLPNDPLRRAYEKQEASKRLDKKSRRNFVAIYDKMFETWENASMRKRTIWLKGRGFDKEEIAGTLNIHLSTVKRYLKSARKAGILPMST